MDVTKTLEPKHAQHSKPEKGWRLCPLNLSKVLANLDREERKLLKAAISRQLAIRQAHPPDWRNGMLRSSHADRFALLARFVDDEAVLKDLHYRRDLIEGAIASLETLTSSPTATAQRAGAALKIPGPLADAISRPQASTRVK